LTDSGSVTVGVRVEWFPEASRAVAGPEADRISGGKIRNTAQVVAVNAETKNIAAFDEARRKNEDEGGVTLAVNVETGKTYHFLVLLGFWERKYADEAQGGGYKYDEGKLPTLLAAGFVGNRQIGSNEKNIEITMCPLVVDTKFVPGSGSGLQEVQPRVGEESLLVPAAWEINWEIQKGKYGKSGFEFLLAARETINAGAGDPGFKYLKRVLNGVPEDAALNSVVGDLISLSLGTLAEDDTGSVNFNLGYVPFGLTGGGYWEAFKERKSPFDLASGGPVWVIRNGVNDEAQDGSTSFSAAWNGTTVNGNGALAYRVLDPDLDEDGDGVSNKKELEAGTDPGNADTDGDGFSDGMETDNGFDPLDDEDYPGDDNSKSDDLKITGLTIENRMDERLDIVFTTGGYAGTETANGYYGVVKAGPAALAPELKDYKNKSPDYFKDMAPGLQSKKRVILPGNYDEPNDGYDVYVVIMKGGKVSAPVKINSKDAKPGMAIIW
jgi:hypothetical protein